MAEASPDPDPVSVFSLLGNRTRLSILESLREEATSDGVGRGVVAYSTLRAAVGEPDSGKFNYHLTRLTGHFVEKLPGGYTLREPGKEVVRALRSGTITRTPTFDPVETALSCLRCGGTILASYANGHVFAHCDGCAGLLGFEYVPDGTLLAVTFPPAGTEARDLATVVEPATLRFEHRVRMMADGLCPECGGTVTATIRECPDHTGSATSLCDRCHTGFAALTVMTCEVCDRRRVVPPAFACTGRDPVADALAAAGVEGAWDRYAETVRWPVWTRGDGDPEVVYAPPADGARIVVRPDLSAVWTSPPPGPEVRIE